MDTSTVVVKTFSADTMVQAKAEKPVDSPGSNTITPSADSVSKEIYQPSTVIKKSESSTTQGFGLVFIDKNARGVTDTIRLMIPNPATAVPPVNGDIKEEKKFLDLPEAVIKTDSVKKDSTVTPLVKETVPELKKGNCRDTATDADFFKLRKLMAAADGEDSMLEQARSYFKNMCFSVLQVKNLGALFLDDGGKYRFYDLAYQHTSDISNFSQLQAEIKDEYYLGRFKAMLRN